MGDPCPREAAVVIVFARDPALGQAKSRIARAAGAQRAAAIHRELLTLAAASLVGFRHLVSHDGLVERPPQLAACFQHAEAFVRQPDGDLGERMRAAVREAAARGHRGFCLVGTDCPSRTPAVIEAALGGLAQGLDTVIGPARDGGYYLLALTDPETPLLGARGWGGSGLLEETLAIARRHALSCRLLEELDDIDTIEDYDRWRRTLEVRS